MAGYAAAHRWLRPGREDEGHKDEPPPFRASPSLGVVDRISIPGGPTSVQGAVSVIRLDRRTMCGDELR
jgi:hypothetical protein